MKRQLLMAFLFATGLHVAAGQFSVEPGTERKIEIGKTESVVLCKDGKVAFEIVCATDNISTRFAAEELAKNLGRVLNTELKILKNKSGSVPALLVGDKKLAAENGVDPDKMDKDAYAVKSIGNDILLIGADTPNEHPLKFEYASSGTLFAVYDFLERFAGVRFYFPGDIGTVTPHIKNWGLPKINIVERPDMPYRKTYDISADLAQLNKDFNYNYRLAGQRYYRMMPWKLPTTHGLALLKLVERFGTTHPEYFALTDKGARHNGTVDLHTPANSRGHICFSNADLKNEIYLDAKAVLSRQAPSTRNMPGNAWGPTSVPGEFFCVSPNDSVYHCRCAGCYPAFSKSKPPVSAQETSDFVWKYMTDIARKLKADGVPGYVTTFAYNPYDKVPNVDIPDNMLVQVCNFGPWASGNMRTDDMELLKQWVKKLHSKTWLWNYCIQEGQMTNIPHSSPNAIGNYYKGIRDSIFGVFLETETDKWHYGYLNYYVLGKVLWNTDADVEALLDEHHRLMFGAAAPEMKDFFETIEKHWMKDIISNTVFTEVGPKNYLPSLHKLWNEIYSSTEIMRIDKLFSEGAVKLKDDQDSLKRLNFIREKFWAPIVDSAKAYEKIRNGQKELTASMPEVQKGAILPDGKGDEPVWKKSTLVRLLPVNDKTEKEIVEVSTVVRAAHDKDYFYFLFDCEEPETDRMSAVERKHDDDIWKDNDIEIFLNPSGDGKKAYQLLVNSCGSMQDFKFEPGYNDPKWNSEAECKISVDPGKRWTAEIRIPRKNMDTAKDRFPANFFRGRILRDKKVHYGYSWSTYIQNNHHIEGYGKLEIKPSEKPISLIRNGDFSEGYNAWAPSQTVNPDNFDRKIYRTAGVSLRLDENLNGMNYYMTEFLKPNTRYCLSFQVKLQDVQKLSQWGGGFYVVIGFGTGKNLYLPQNSFTGTMPWTRQEFEFKTPEKLYTEIKTSCIQFVRANDRTSGTVWVDDVKLVEMPEK